MKGKLFIVFCVDTEGPLYESLHDTFDRLQYHFGIDVVCSPENLEKLRQGIGVPQSIRHDVNLFLKESIIQNYGDWASIEKMLNRITSPKFRNTWRDSQGQGIIYSWFPLDHVGYELNPRNRIIGHHKIFDYYASYLSKTCDKDDAFQFHYHPLAYNKMANSCATYYFNDNHLMSILTRKVIDRMWFPSAFRPGFHAIRPDSHWFLEQWIPFDYANQACHSSNFPSDITQNQLGDWRRAPQIWGGYHPSHDDYQQEGTCRRWIFRCLNANARIRNITEVDIIQAYKEAQQYGRAVLAVTDHDFRNMEASIIPFYEMIQKHAQNFDVDLFFSNAENAARAFTQQDSVSPGLFAHISPYENTQAYVLNVHVSNKIFGPQPFLAIKTYGGNYYYDNFDVALVEPYSNWTYVFDWQTFPLQSVEKIGIACSSPSGIVDVVLISPHSQEYTCHTLHN